MEAYKLQNLKYCSVNKKKQASTDSSETTVGGETEDFVGICIKEGAVAQVILLIVIVKNKCNKQTYPLIRIFLTNKLKQLN